MELKDRLKIARTKAKLSQQELADKVKMKQPSYQALESGRVKRSSFLPAIARATMVNLEWLENEIGGMEPLPLQDVHSYEEGSPLVEGEIEIPYFEDFMISCGTGSFVEVMQGIHKNMRISGNELRSLGADPSSVVVARAAGNSMQPTILDKSKVYFDTSRTTIKDECIYAIEHGGLIKFKRLYNLPNKGVRIFSDNKDDYPEDKLSAQQIIDENFKVLGQVFKIETSFKL